MTQTTVTTQEQLDQALADPTRTKVLIDSPRGVWLKITSNGSATVEAWGSATVEAGGSATVRAGDSATVRAWGSATVEAWGSATVEAWDSSTVRAGNWVAIHLHSARATVTGGHIIDITGLDLTHPGTWCAYHGVHVDDDGGAHLFKAVDDNLYAGHSWTPTQYPIGATITPDQWRDNNLCGYGLHASPTARQARGYYSAAARFLEVVCPVTDLRPIDASKAKAPALLVLREVDLNGSPLKAAS